jgi:hypothetical protein
LGGRERDGEEASGRKQGKTGGRQPKNRRCGRGHGGMEFIRSWRERNALYPEASIASGTFCAGQKIIGVNLEHRPAVSGFPAACALRDRARRQAPARRGGLFGQARQGPRWRGRAVGARERCVRNGPITLLSRMIVLESLLKEDTSVPDGRSSHLAYYAV